MHAPLEALTILACLLASSAACGQRATEVYIPIGRSPGVSGKSTAIGTCTAVDAKERLVTVREGERTCTVKVTKETRIYLDRSRLGLPNTYGTFDDLRGALVMEVKYRDAQRAAGGACEWIKVQVEAPAGKK